MQKRETAKATWWPVGFGCRTCNCTLNPQSPPTPYFLYLSTVPCLTKANKCQLKYLQIESIVNIIQYCILNAHTYCSAKHLWTYIGCGLQPVKPMSLTLSAHSMPCIQFRKMQSKQRSRNSLTCCPTSILGLIKTHIHRLSGRESNGSGGILLTWCQGLNSVGSASRRQPPPKGLLHLCFSTRTPPSTPNPPPWFTGTWNSTVWTPLSDLSSLWALSTKKKKVFLSQCCSSCHLGSGGPQEERAVKTWNI